MAFDKVEFSQLDAGWGDRTKFYSYRTSDTQATVNTAGYFNDLYARLKVGDVIHVYSGIGGTPVTYTTYVNELANGQVDVADGLVIPSTDTA